MAAIHYKTTNSYLLLVILFLLIILFSRCEIKEPGSRGELILNPDYIVEISHETDESIENIYTCEEIYAFTVLASEINESCETYNDWDFLYREAVRQGDGKISQIKCPLALCQQLNPWIVRQRSGCDELGAPFIEIQYNVRCISEDAELVEGLPFYDPDRLTIPFDDTEGPLPLQPPSSESIKSFVYKQDPAVCPGVFYFAVDLKEKITSCNPPDFRPFIDKTRIDATTLWNNMSCFQHCQKQDLVEEHVKWDCITGENGTSWVEVSSQWSVACEED